MQNARAVSHYEGLVTLGWITGLGPELVRCRVKDISQHGATLILEPGQPPEEFRLYFSPYATTYRMCEVRWRKEDSVGVQFVGTRANPAVVV
jgi:hypothetical protein